ncbi:hypothetical protein [Roseibium suaedae]|uniref:Uncharacterized protein n=1 Tax=Roseibium suaedae TaxID=735517 RepID=A0A1M7AW40_9HYPH|nr:hypothetical protein [Roseibium suaedae]SHL46953.1 hypothetical protein SAMN05444272_0658 [Roseibium suaedae]
MSSDPKPFVSALAETSAEQSLPCNMTFSYSKLPEGNYVVSLFGFTAGPPATINSPQLIVSSYNPAAMFNGWSIGGQYGAYAMAYLGEEKGVPTLFFQGWITSIESGAAFQYVSYSFALT